MRVVADSHAIVWYMQGSPRLSTAARDALDDAEATDGIVVSVATLVDLWYVTQTTKGVTATDLVDLRDRLDGSSSVAMQSVDVVVADAYTLIPRDVLTDPWDRLIVATAQALGIQLVTRDGAIHAASIVQTIW